MKERAINLRDWEVRAFLAGIKSIIARPIVPKPVIRCAGGWYISIEKKPEAYRAYSHRPTEDDLTDYVAGIIRYAPYQPGDVLWGRETWAAIWPDRCSDGRIYDDDHVDGRPIRDNECVIEYRADTQNVHPGGWPDDAEPGECPRWRPSTHMPRWASRITCTVTNVSALRVADLRDDELRGMGTTEPDDVDAAHRALFDLYWNQDWPLQPHYLDPSGINEWAWLYEVTQP